MAGSYPVREGSIPSAPTKILPGSTTEVIQTLTLNDKVRLLDREPSPVRVGDQRALVALAAGFESRSRLHASFFVFARSSNSVAQDAMFSASWATHCELVW
jgi:hypothetical protein